MGIEFARRKLTRKWARDRIVIGIEQRPLANDRPSDASRLPCSSSPGHWPSLPHLPYERHNIVCTEVQVNPRDVERRTRIHHRAHGILLPILRFHAHQALSPSHGQDRVELVATQRYGTIRSMVKRTEIDSLCRQISVRFRPDRVVLFGSYAYGQPTSDSDVDVLVVMRHRGPSYRLAARIRNSIDVDFPVDVLVRSPREVRRQLALDDPFMLEVMSKGEVLHEARNPAMA